MFTLFVAFLLATPICVIGPINKEDLLRASFARYYAEMDKGIDQRNPNLGSKYVASSVIVTEGKAKTVGKRPLYIKYYGWIDGSTKIRSTTTIEQFRHEGKSVFITTNQIFEKSYYSTRSHRIKTSLTDMAVCDTWLKLPEGWMIVKEDVLASVTPGG